jgi:hypothetical protein
MKKKINLQIEKGGIGKLRFRQSWKTKVANSKQ